MKNILGKANSNTKTPINQIRVSHNNTKQSSSKFVIHLHANLYYQRNYYNRLLYY